MNKAMKELQARVPLMPHTYAALGFALHGVAATQQVGRLCDHSAQVQAGDVFLCLPRAHAQRQAFVHAAVQVGAQAVVCVGDTGVDVPEGVASLMLPDMAVLGAWLRQYFGTETCTTRCIGVTGTDGKTSVAWMLRQALARYAGAAWSSGTLGWMCSDDDIYDLGNTTPSLLCMHYLLAAAQQEKLPYWVMEVSSHGIEQQRIAGIPISAVMWTTLGHDHLQDHGGFENYAALKASVLHQVVANGGVAVVNAAQERMQPYVADMPHHAYRLGRVDGQADKAVMYGDMRAVGVLDLCVDGASIGVDDVPVGVFHAENMTGVAQMLRCLGLSMMDIQACVSAMPAPKGRMQAIENAQGLQVYVDYAHTPEGLQACLQSARGLASGRVLVVFGCGGNRDVAKRPQMGQAAVAQADEVWVTSDNPRDEAPMQIIQDIVAGMDDSNHVHVCEQRGVAIAAALDALGVDDVLVVAGKGHEQGMVVGDTVLPWDDAAYVQEYLAAKEPTCR